MKRANDSGAMPDAKRTTADDKLSADGACRVCTGPPTEPVVQVGLTRASDGIVCARCVETRHDDTVDVIHKAGMAYCERTSQYVYCLDGHGQVLSFRGKQAISDREHYEVDALPPRNNFGRSMFCCTRETALAMRRRRETYTAYDKDEKWCDFCIHRDVPSRSERWVFPVSYIAPLMGLDKSEVVFDEYTEHFNKLPDGSFAEMTFDQLAAKDPIEFRMQLGTDVGHVDYRFRWWP